VSGNSRPEGRVRTFVQRQTRLVARTTGQVMSVSHGGSRQRPTVERRREKNNC